MLKHLSMVRVSAFVDSLWPTTVWLCVMNLFLAVCVQVLVRLTPFLMQPFTGMTLQQLADVPLSQTWATLGSRLTLGWVFGTCMVLVGLREFLCLGLRTARWMGDWAARPSHAAAGRNQDKPE